MLQSEISIKLHNNFIEITLRHRFSPVNLLLFSEQLFLRTPQGSCFCVLESLFNKVGGFQGCNFIKKRLQSRCFPVNVAKFLRTATLFWRNSANDYFCAEHKKSFTLISKENLCLIFSFKYTTAALNRKLLSYFVFSAHKVAENLQPKIILTYQLFIYKLIQKTFLFTFTQQKAFRIFLSNNE